MIGQLRKRNNTLKGWLHLELSNNSQDSEKGETDYSHDVLRLNSAYLIFMKKHVFSRTAEMS